jgi:hypothetical protein
MRRMVSSLLADSGFPQFAAGYASLPIILVICDGAGASNPQAW